MENSYDKRNVQYEHIHSIATKDFEKLVELVDIKNNEIILDACCGYGSVTKHLCDRIDELKYDTTIFAVDNSDLQINRIRDNLGGRKNVNIYQEDVINMSFPDNFFDTIVIKMGLHEVTREMQYKMMKEFYRVLKPEGKIAIRELALSEATHPIFCKFIKEKDKLGEFESLVANRYFPKEIDTLDLLQDTGFSNVVVAHNITPTLSIRNRKSELVSALRIGMEKNGYVNEEELETISEGRTKELINFATHLSDNEKAIMKYSETRDDQGHIINVTMSAEKAIFIATKSNL